MKVNQYQISEEKNVIDDHLLDIIGNEFKFDHEKGISEWLKNAVDAYIRSNTPDSKQLIKIKFTDSQSNEATIECIDFVGMSSTDIDKALKRWGDPNAAKRGLQKKVYGGHGNGGKFYMRQMFENSYFVTYKQGLLNVFGFNSKKKYGFAKEYKNKNANLAQALKIAGISEKEIPSEIIKKIKSNTTGFTLVRGIGPRGMKNVVKVNAIIDKLRKHPQSMRILDRISVEIQHNGRTIVENLKPVQIKPLEGFEDPKVIDVPKTIKLGGLANGGNSIILANQKYPSGRLVLRTSEVALSSSSKFSELNRIDIIGELGVVASYPLRELGLYYPQTDFIFGECSCPILEDPEDDCVMNDRTRLSNNPKSVALLKFIGDQVKSLCEEISGKEEKERQEINKKLSSNYNNFLDEWKNQFMSKILSEILVGPGTGEGGGHGDGGSLGDYGQGKGNGGRSGGGKGEKQGGGDTPHKGRRFPKVLLSGHDEDPLNLGNKLFLQPAQGLIYQRPRDVDEGLYWINTSSPLAAAILDQYNANSPRWRDYLFQRYVDIFIKEALLMLERKEPERFNATTIDGDILGKLVSRIHGAAAKDLNSFLFEEKYQVENTSK